MDNVLQELARFLDALPYQVQAWDRKVIEHLTHNREAFARFQQGCGAVKWSIYSSIRYAPNR